MVELQGRCADGGDEAEDRQGVWMNEGRYQRRHKLPPRIHKLVKRRVSTRRILVTMKIPQSQRRYVVPEKHHLSEENGEERAAGRKRQGFGGKKKRRRERLFGIKWRKRSG